MANWAVNYRKAGKSKYRSRFFKGDGDFRIEGLKENTDYEVVVTFKDENSVLIWDGCDVVDSGESGEIRVSFSGLAYSVRRRP